jgi:hypothetical protein
MYSFLVNITLFASLAVMIYMLARALPRITEEQHEAAVPVSFFDRVIDRLPMERIDIVISTFLEKLLRKFKLFVSKLDTVINAHLARVRKSSPIHKEQQGAILKEKMEAMAESVEKTDEKK